MSTLVHVINNYIFEIILTGIVRAIHGKIIDAKRFNVNEVRLYFILFLKPSVNDFPHFQM